MRLDHRALMRPVGYTLSCAALCSLAIGPVAAVADEGATGSADGGSDSSSAAIATTGQRVYAAPVASEKLETVYLHAGADGAVRNVEVSATLKNPLGEGQLADSSTLSNIKSDEGDATYTGAGDAMVWDARGGDVSYTGTTAQQAPVSMRVTYLLDGNEVPADRVAGATGRLTIRCEYENTATARVNDAGEEALVPFTFITAMLFDSDAFKNVEVKNAKLIEDGNRTIVAGFAMPGLAKSLGTLAEGLDIPECFEVTADVVDFEMGQSLTIATAGLLDGIDVDGIGASGFGEAGDALAAAMGAVIDGAGELKDGFGQLADGVVQAKNASTQLADGADGLANGAKSANDAIGSEGDSADAGTLVGGMTALKDGYDTHVLATVVNTVNEVETFVANHETGLALTWEALRGMIDAISRLEELIDAIGAIDRGDVNTMAYELNTLRTQVDDSQAAIATVEGMIASFEQIDLADVERDLDAAGGDIASVAASIESASANVAAAADDLAGDGGASSFAGVAGANASDASQAIGSVLATMTDEEQAKYGAALQAALDDVQGIEGDLLALDGKLGEAGANLQSGADDLQIAASDVQATSEALEQVQSALETLKGSLPTQEDMTRIADLLASAEAGLENENIALMDQSLNSLRYAMNGLDLDGLNGEVSILQKYYPTVIDYLVNTNAQQALDDLHAKLDAVTGGVQRMSDGMAAERDGLVQLGEGVDELASGAGTLAENLHAYDDAMGALQEGATAAAGGTEALVNGLQQFNDQGISHIIDVIDDAIELTDRMGAIADAAKAYTNFSGITEGAAGSVKFIIETDAIER